MKTERKNKDKIRRNIGLGLFSLLSFTPIIYDNSYQPNIDPISGAKVNFVSSASLPSGEGWRALGIYNPVSHSIAVDYQDQPPADVHSTYLHEQAHALGIYSEIAADMYATQRGQRAFNRTPEQYRLAE